MPWLTPDAIEESRQVWAIDLPGAPAWRRPVWGALLELTKAANWEAVGLGADEAAEIMLEAYGTIRKVHVLQPGDIVTSAAPPPQDDRLLCDGSLYNVSEYQELFSAIGYAFGGSGGTFAVPDIAGRVILASGSGAGLTPRTLGQSGGGEQVTLLTGNMPEHQHSVHQHLQGIAQLGVGEPVSIPTIGSGSTGSSGSGDPVNIMPPFIVLHSFIVAR